VELRPQRCTPTEDGRIKDNGTDRAGKLRSIEEHFHDDPAQRPAIQDYIVCAMIQCIAYPCFQVLPLGITEMRESHRRCLLIIPIGDSQERKAALRKRLARSQRLFPCASRPMNQERPDLQFLRHIPGWQVSQGARNANIVDLQAQRVAKQVSVHSRIPRHLRLVHECACDREQFPRDRFRIFGENRANNRLSICPRHAKYPRPAGAFCALECDGFGTDSCHQNGERARAASTMEQFA
jgi:hypothetical protein